MPSRPSALFSLNPVPEIHLARAPLEKVLTQVQFSLTPDLVSEEGERTLAAALARYPVRRRGQALNVTISPATGMIENKAVTTLSFADRAQTWTVTVMETAVALETTAYDFSRRLLRPRSRSVRCGRRRRHPAGR